MLNIKILGPGCANCRRLEERALKVVSTTGLQADVEHVTDYVDIMKWNILSTPGLVINDKVVSTGRIPSEAEIAGWLQAA